MPIEKHRQEKMTRLYNLYHGIQESYFDGQLHLLKIRLNRKACAEAQEILQDLAQQIQQRAHHKISEIVTKALQTVFEDPYEFKIEFTKKRGKTEAEIKFVRDGQEIDPMTASGGGVVDVTAFALRLACLCLSRPRARLLVVLDEPFKFVSVDLLPRIRYLLKMLTEETDAQFIIITHLPELACGKVYKLE